MVTLLVRLHTLSAELFKPRICGKWLHALPAPCKAPMQIDCDIYSAVRHQCWLGKQLAGGLGKRVLLTSRTATARSKALPTPFSTRVPQPIMMWSTHTTGVPVDDSTERILLQSLAQDHCVVAAEEVLQQGTMQVLLAASDSKSTHG